MPGKLEKFAENRAFPNLLEYEEIEAGEVGNPKGKWRELAGDKSRLVMELACGKGDFSLGYARLNPDSSVVGVDIKGARLWSGARRAIEQQLHRVCFLRTYIEQLERYVAPGELDEIWITFPDPFPKRRQEKKRLTSPRFLPIYRRLLAPGGLVHFKTDSPLLWRYTLETLPVEGASILHRVDDLYNEKDTDPVWTIQTPFERQHLRDGKRIRYVQFRP